MKRTLNLEQLNKFITEETEKIMNLGNPLDVEMNKMDKVQNSDGKAYVKSNEDGSFEKKAPKNIEKTEEATEVKMNQNDKEKGSDEKIAAAVEVSAAGSTKSGDSVEGMHNSNFETKTEQPSTEASAPFEDRKKDVKMNEMDKEDKDGDSAKTFVQPGTEMKDGYSTGQAKADFSEKAKNETEKIEKIAKGIQLPESFKNKQELINYITEEAKKISKLL